MAAQPLQFFIVIDEKRQIAAQNNMRCHPVHIGERDPSTQVPAQILEGSLALHERALKKARQNVFRLDPGNQFWKQIRRNDP